MVCNRLMLWSLFGILQACASLAILQQYASYEAQNQFALTWDLLVGALEMLSVGTIWLVFFPPVWYRGRIERTASPAVPAES